MLYHHVVIIFSIKMSVKSLKAEPTCSCVSAAASAESCGSLVIIATCNPKTPSPVRMDQHPPETMVDGTEGFDKITGWDYLTPFALSY